MRLRDVSRVLHYDARRRAVDKKVKLTQEESEVDPAWRRGAERTTHSRYLLYLAVGTFLFFVTAVTTAYFIRYAGIDRTVSHEKIEIVTQGATSVDGGSVVPLTIRVVNRNPVTVQGAVLYVAYPSGVYKREGDVLLSHESKDTELFLGEIQRGEIITRQVEPIFYGKSGETKEVSYLLEYTVPGVGKRQTKSGVHTVLLRSAPVLVSKPEYTTVVAGKEVTFAVTVESNSPDVLPMVYVSLQYPAGFTPKQFSPNPANVGGTEWRFPRLQPGAKKRITVVGTIRGEERILQAISAEARVAPSGEKIGDAVVVAGEDEVIDIGEAFLSVQLRLNGSTSEKVVVSPGETVRGSIRWLNQDSSRLSNLSVVATITGTGVDESSITPEDGGYFDEVLKRIVWDRESSRSFSSVSVGDGGSVSFSFRALPNRAEVADEKQKYVQVSISARAHRSHTGSVEEVKDIAIGRADLRSVFQIVGSTLYATSVVRNSGPFPPQPGEVTTYALKYFIKNGGNDVSDVVLEIPLGRDITVTDVVSGISLNEWEYDSDARVVTVRIPFLTASGPRSSRAVEVQVAVEPQSRDIGSHLVLAKQATYRARDIYVGEVFEGTVGRLTTEVATEQVRDTSVSGSDRPVFELSD